jgi:archaeal flagellar protein FlaJ
LPLQDKVAALSYRLFGGVSPFFLQKVFPSLKGALERGGVKIYPETYISMMLFITLLTLPVAALGVLGALALNFLPLLVLAAVPAFVVVGFIVVPMNNASDRSIGLERELPFAAAYISVMSSGGIAPYDSFKRLTQVNLMPAMSKESRDIVRDVEIFGVDPLTALEVAAKKTPLDLFKDFLGGYASTVIIGGDIGHFLERKAEDIFKARAVRVKAAADRLGMLLETFIIVEVMMSLCFYILFAVSNISTTGGATQKVSTLADFSGMLLYTFIFTPMLSVMFIYLAHSMQTKTPQTDNRPYKVYGISCIIAIVVFMLLTNFMGMAQLPIFTQLQELGVDLPVALAVSLCVSAAPAAILHIRLQKIKGSMEQGVANFLRDLTEVRKTGLSPEKCIESLSTRDYGAFSKEIRKISTDISWGIPIKQVMMDFLHRTKSWMVQIVMFLLVETIDVGGGTIAMIDSLARFNNMTQETEKEKKMSVRPYVMMPYLASILLVATTVMMMNLTTGISVDGAASAGPDPLMQTIFLTSVIFHSYLIGIVAGKISDDSVASGLKHAAVLVIIAIIVAKLAPQIIHLTG